MSEKIRLHLNENPLGLPKKVEQLLVENIHVSSQYFDVDHSRLAYKLAQKHQVSEDEVALGCGASRLFLRLARLYLNKSNELLVPQYMYQLYRLVANENGAGYVEAPLKDFKFDIESIISSVTDKTAMIVLTNPGNPMGGFFKLEEFEKLLRSVPESIIVVVDQAYIEYAMSLNSECQCATPLTRRYKNLVVLNTFSKSHGLAGLRIGYAIAHHDIIEKLKRYYVRFALNSLAEQAAFLSLEDEDYLSQTLELNKKGRHYLESEFAALGLRCIPTSANFITVDLKQNATDIVNELMRQGILVTSLASHDLPNFLRISIGNLQDLKRFVGALKQIIQRISS